MGVVYKARQSRFNRIVALKLLHAGLFADQQQTQKLMKEAKATALLEHPNIVKVYSLSLSSEGQPFLVLEYVEGQTLADQLKQQGSLSHDQFYAIFTQVLSALEAAHEAGVIHRDLKPNNILVTKSGVAKLADFGIAKLSNSVAGQGATQTGTLMGTPWYMSPEQCEGKKVDGRSDLYSLACVMHEALTGNHLFEAETAIEVMYRQLHAQPQPIEKPIGESLRQLILRLLQKDPANRYQTVSQVIAAFKACHSDTSTGSHSVKTQDLSKRRATKLWLFFAPILMIAVGAAVWKLSEKPAAEPVTALPTNDFPAYYYNQQGNSLFLQASAQQRISQSQAATTRALAIANLKKAVSSSIATKQWAVLLDSYETMGSVYERGGPEQAAQAAHSFDLAQEMAAKYLNPDSREALFAARANGNYRRRIGDFAGAKKIYEKALSTIKNRTPDKDDAQLEYGLGDSLLGLLRVSEAEPHCKRAFNIAQDLQLVDVESANFAAAYGECLFKLQKYALAEKVYGQCATSCVALNERTNLANLYVTAVERQVECLLQLQRPEAASALCAKGVKYIKQWMHENPGEPVPAQLAEFEAKYALLRKAAGRRR